VFLWRKEPGDSVAKEYENRRAVNEVYKNLVIVFLIIFKHSEAGYSCLLEFLFVHTIELDICFYACFLVVLNKIVFQMYRWDWFSHEALIYLVCFMLNCRMCLLMCYTLNKIILKELNYIRPYQHIERSSLSCHKPKAESVIRFTVVVIIESNPTLELKGKFTRFTFDIPLL
jgi:hypothetical protein